jgi:ankyrin repeat protein
MTITFAGWLVAVLAMAAMAPLMRQASAPALDRIDFARDVQPIFRTHCYGCHSTTLQSGNFRLDRRRDSMPNRVGANGARIVPGDSARSRLYQRVSGSEGGLQMPPTGALTPEELRTIKRWIDQGADWPDELAGETPTPPRDPVAMQVLDAVRRGDRRRVDRLLKANPSVARAPGIGGITPLMYAALYRDAASARQILAMGADANARNDAGATALMWAVDDLAITQLLLERGADPNARSADGRTPVLLAAGHAGAVEVVKALLDAGATLAGQAVLTRAAEAGDAAILRLLLARGANASALPNDLAMRSGCSDCVALLLQSAARPELTRALEAAAGYGDSPGMQMLLTRGAEATATSLRLASASEAVPNDGVTALLERGVRDEEALGLALRHGDTAVVAALRKAGLTDRAPREAPALKKPPMPRSARAAIEVSLPLLQHADTVFLKTAGCVSCHNNSLFQMTAAIARRQGFRIDERAMQEQMTRMRTYLESWRERQLQDIAIPGRIDTASYILAGLAAMNYPADAATDALARYVRRRQLADGGWRVASHRPPIESSDITVTALSLRALQAYAPAPLRAEYTEAIKRGASWLARAQPTTTEDHSYLVLGLGWAGENAVALQRAARAVIALQRPDGGWSQLPTLPSDAYATGQALSALAQAGALKTTDPVYQKGVRFLLDSQLEDGSWYVSTRAVSIQPYFDSGFPHRNEQFISAAASNWATMALALASR